MKAAYGSWRDKESSVDNSNASSSHKMPPLLRLNSTGESPASDERPVQSMGQHKTAFSSNRKQRGFIGTIASHFVPQKHTPGARHLLDIHTAVGGIASLNEHLGGHQTRTMASYVTRGAHPLDRQAAKMPKPFTRSNPSHLRANRYGQWTVDGQSPYMQPGVFPCHVFSAMQVGTAFSQTLPCLWGGQSKLLASVSDSVLNCKVGVGQLPFQVPPATFPVGGKGSLFKHSCDNKSSSQHKSPSQQRAGGPDSGHCVNAARKHNDHQCVCEREGGLCSTSILQQDSCLPHKITVSVYSNPGSSVSKAPEDICACDIKTTEEVAKDTTDIPETLSMASASISSSKMSSLLREVLRQHHSADHEQNASMASEGPSEAPHDMSTQTCGDETHSAGCQVETSMDQSDKTCMNGLDDSRDMSFLESELSSGELQPSFTSSPKKWGPSSSDIMEVAGASYADVGDTGDDVSLRSEPGTAAAGAGSSQPSPDSGASVKPSCSAAPSDSESDQSLQFADLSTDGANHEDDDWDDWGDDDSDGAYIPMDSDFVADLHIPMLSSFLPGQVSHSTAVLSAATCSIVTTGIISTDISKVVDALDVVFCSEGGEDHPDGASNRMFNDDGSVRATVKCKAQLEAANNTWNLHYATPVPEERTNTKVWFQCGEGIDKFHEFEPVEGEHDPEDGACNMTCMELQKLKDEERRRKWNKASSSKDQDDEEDEDDI